MPSISVTRIGLLLGVPLALVLGAHAVSWAAAALKTWTSGETLTAADLNSNFTAINNAFVDLTGTQTITGPKTFSSGVLRVTSESNTQQQITTFNDTVNNQSYLFFDRARGTAPSPAPVQMNDELGRIYFRGYHGAAMKSGAYMRAELEAAPAAQIPTRLMFFTSSDSIEGVLRMTITSAGRIGIGTATPQARLDVANGDVHVSTAGNGIILKSPDGNTCRKITIDNSGNLVTGAITCP